MTPAPPPPFHRCQNGDQLRAALESALGRPLAAAVADQIAPAQLFAVVAGGSIPLGLASAASDVDLIAITGSPDQAEDQGPAAPLPAEFDGTSGLLSHGPRFREQIVRLEHIEIDLVSANYDDLLTTLQTLQRSSVALNLAEIRLLSRLKTGWWLHVAGHHEDALRPLRHSRSLDVRASVWNYVGAVQDYDDAVAALEDAPPLAAHLGRLAVERAVAAYFAATGYAFLGTKWLRLLVVAHETPQRVALRHRLLELRTFSQDLLFPSATTRPAVAAHLQRVRALLIEARTLAETDPMIRVAYARTPLLADTPPQPDDHDQ